MKQIAIDISDSININQGSISLGGFSSDGKPTQTRANDGSKSPVNNKFSQNTNDIEEFTDSPLGDLALQSIGDQQREEGSDINCKYQDKDNHYIKPSTELTSNITMGKGIAIMTPGEEPTTGTEDELERDQYFPTATQKPPLKGSSSTGIQSPSSSTHTSDTDMNKADIYSNQSMESNSALSSPPESSLTSLSPPKVDPHDDMVLNIDENEGHVQSEDDFYDKTEDLSSPSSPFENIFNDERKNSSILENGSPEKLSDIEGDLHVEGLNEDDVEDYQDDGQAMMQITNVDIDSSAHKEEEVDVADDISNRINALFEEKIEEQKRVMVYELDSDGTWDSRGTGYLICAYLQSYDATCMIVRSDEDRTVILMISPIVVGRVYNKQQSTLILWTENDGNDVALSFISSEDCTSMLHAISEYQNDYSMDSLFSTCDLNENVPIELLANGVPEMDLKNITSIEDIFEKATESTLFKDKLVSLIDIPTFVRQLLDIFEIVEKEGDKKAIDSIGTIVRTLFMILDTRYFEIFTSEENFVHVLGVLEYESKSETKTNDFRDFFRSRPKFKEIITYIPPQLADKITYIYRLRYLKDAVLPTHLDESNSSVFSTSIFFSLIEVVDDIYQNVSVLENLFSIILDPETSPDTRRDNIAFLFELCSVRRALLTLGRQYVVNFNMGEFFKVLIYHGLLDVFVLGFKSKDIKEKEMIASILLVFFDHDADLIREICKESWYRSKKCQMNSFNVQNGKASRVIEPLTLNRWTDQIATYPAEALGGDSVVSGQTGKSFLFMLLDTFINRTETCRLRYQYGELVKILLNTNSDERNSPINSTEFKSFTMEDVLDQDSFLSIFFSTYSDVLLDPVINKEKFRETHWTDRPRVADILNRVCEIICFLVNRHTMQTMYLCLRNPTILKNVAKCLEAKEGYLRLTALRVFNRIMNTNNFSFISILINNNILSKVLELYTSTLDRYNMINSACLDFFESIVSGGNNTAMKNLMEKNEKEINQLSHIDVFARIKQNYLDFVNMKEGADRVRAASPDSSTNAEQFGNDEEQYGINADYQFLDLEEQGMYYSNNGIAEPNHTFKQTRRDSINDWSQTALEKSIVPSKRAWDNSKDPLDSMSLGHDGDIGLSNKQRSSNMQQLIHQSADAPRPVINMTSHLENKIFLAEDSSSSDEPDHPEIEEEHSSPTKPLVELKTTSASDLLSHVSIDDVEVVVKSPRLAHGEPPADQSDTTDGYGKTNGLRPHLNGASFQGTGRDGSPSKTDSDVVEDVELQSVLEGAASENVPRGRRWMETATT